MKSGKIFLGAVLAFVAASCGNAELESRITKLEGRLAAIEGKGDVASTSKAQPIAASNTVNTPAATPAVAPAEKPEGPLPAFSFNEELHDFGTI